MAKLLTPTLSRELVTHFTDKLKIDVDYKKQIMIADKMIQQYGFEDLILIIDYISIYPLKNRIYSLWYLKFIIEDMLPRAKAYKLKNEKEKLDEFTEDKLVKNTRKQSKSMFKRGDF